MIVSPPVAAGQDRKPAPSADELWRTYPLQQTPEPDVTPLATQQAAEAPAEGGTPRAADDGTNTPLVGAAGLLLILAAGTAALRIRSRQPKLPRIASPLLPVAAAVAMLPEERPRSPRITALGDGPRPPARDAPEATVRPPDPRRAWTAEVQWSDSRFAVDAQARDGEERIRLAESDPLPWPPADEKAVRDLRRAAERLEAALLAAGWTPLAPGSAWYAKRFAWAGAPKRSARAPAPAPILEPVAALPRSDVASGAGRFTRQTEWPADIDALWRCEIKWHAGYAKSHFDAVAHGPKRLRGTTLGRSDVFKWLLKGDPEPDDAVYTTEVRRLAERLVAAGWEAAGRGRHWYELRFVWRREDAPPDRLEPVREEVSS